MSYTKREEIQVAPGEAAIELDNGALVAVSCVRVPSNGAIMFSATARAIDAAGRQRMDSTGRPIQTHLTHQDRDASTADTVARDCLLAVLGEPVETVVWGADFLRDVSIRNAISINSVTATVDAAQVL